MFIIFAAIFTISLFTVLLVKISPIENQFNHKIGAQSLSMIDALHESEFELFYIEQAAKYSLKDAIAVSKTQQELNNNFHENFNQYIEKDPRLSSLKVSYNIRIIEDKAVLTTDINIDYGKDNLHYYRNPSFTINIEQKTI
jgi:hypothetical protein